VLVLIAVARQIRIPALVQRPALRHAVAFIPVYATGALAAFWTIERVVASIGLAA
jgi:hypothetical protein